MKINSKLVLALLMMIVLFMGFNSNEIYAAEKEGKAEKVDVVKLKKELVEKHKNKVKKYKITELKDRTELIESEIHKMYQEGLSEDEINQRTNELGLYKLNIPEEEPTFSINSIRSNVTLSKPSIYYDSFSSQWVVSANGSWLNEGWKADVPLCCYPINIGYDDAFGITYYNTSGTYATVVKGSSFVARSSKGWTQSSSYPSDGNGKIGVAFQYQDRVRLYQTCCNAIEYLGESLSVVMTYDSGFSKFNGYARTFYTHTWDESDITGITFGVGKGSYNVDVRLSDTVKGWTIYSTGDTAF